jgi:hypothetical protein
LASLCAAEATTEVLYARCEAAGRAGEIRDLVEEPIEPNVLRHCRARTKQFNVILERLLEIRSGETSLSNNFEISACPFGKPA